MHSSGTPVHYTKAIRQILHKLLDKTAQGRSPLSGVEDYFVRSGADLNLIKTYLFGAAIVAQPIEEETVDEHEKQIKKKKNLLNKKKKNVVENIGSAGIDNFLAPLFGQDPTLTRRDAAEVKQIADGVRQELQMLIAQFDDLARSAQTERKQIEDNLTRIDLVRQPEQGPPNEVAALASRLQRGLISEAITLVYEKIEMGTSSVFTEMPGLLQQIGDILARVNQYLGPSLWTEFASYKRAVATVRMHIFALNDKIAPLRRELKSNAITEFQAEQSASEFVIRYKADLLYAATMAEQTASNALLSAGNMTTDDLTYYTKDLQRLSNSISTIITAIALKARERLDEVRGETEQLRQMADNKQIAGTTEQEIAENKSFELALTSIYNKVIESKGILYRYFVGQINARRAGQTVRARSIASTDIDPSQIEKIIHELQHITIPRGCHFPRAIQYTRDVNITAAEDERPLFIPIDADALVSRVTDKTKAHDEPRTPEQVKHILESTGILFSSGRRSYVPASDLLEFATQQKTAEETAEADTEAFDNSLANLVTADDPESRQQYLSQFRVPPRRAMFGTHVWSYLFRHWLEPVGIRTDAEGKKTEVPSLTNFTPSALWQKDNREAFMAFLSDLQSNKNNLGQAYSVIVELLQMTTPPELLMDPGQKQFDALYEKEEGRAVFVDPAVGLESRAPTAYELRPDPNSPTGFESEENAQKRRRISSEFNDQAKQYHGAVAAIHQFMRNAASAVNILKQYDWLPHLRREETILPKAVDLMSKGVGDLIVVTRQLNKSSKKLRPVITLPDWLERLPDIVSKVTDQNKQAVIFGIRSAVYRLGLALNNLEASEDFLRLRSEGYDEQQINQMREAMGLFNLNIETVSGRSAADWNAKLEADSISSGDDSILSSFNMLPESARDFFDYVFKLSSAHRIKQNEERIAQGVRNRYADVMSMFEKEERKEVFDFLFRREMYLLLNNSFDGVVYRIAGDRLPIEDKYQPGRPPAAIANVEVESLLNDDRLASVGANFKTKEEKEDFIHNISVIRRRLSGDDRYALGIESLELIGQINEAIMSTQPKASFDKIYEEYCKSHECNFSAEEMFGILTNPNRRATPFFQTVSRLLNDFTEQDFVPTGTSFAIDAAEREKFEAKDSRKPYRVRLRALNQFKKATRQKGARSLYIPDNFKEALETTTTKLREYESGDPRALQEAERIMDRQLLYDARQATHGRMIQYFFAQCPILSSNYDSLSAKEQRLLSTIGVASEEQQKSLRDQVLSAVFGDFKQAGVLESLSELYRLILANLPLGKLLKYRDMAATNFSGSINNIKGTTGLPIRFDDTFGQHRALLEIAQADMKEDILTTAQKRLTNTDKPFGSVYDDAASKDLNARMSTAYLTKLRPARKHMREWLDQHGHEDTKMLEDINFWRDVAGQPVLYKTILKYQRGPRLVEPGLGRRPYITETEWRGAPEAQERPGTDLTGEGVPYRDVVRHQGVFVTAKEKLKELEANKKIYPEQKAALLDYMWGAQRVMPQIELKKLHDEIALEIASDPRRIFSDHDLAAFLQLVRGTNMYDRQGKNQASAYLAARQDYYRNKYGQDLDLQMSLITPLIGAMYSKNMLYSLSWDITQAVRGDKYSDLIELIKTVYPEAILDLVHQSRLPDDQELVASPERGGVYRSFILDQQYGVDRANRYEGDNYEEVIERITRYLYKNISEAEKTRRGTMAKGQTSTIGSSYIPGGITRYAFTAALQAAYTGAYRKLIIRPYGGHSNILQYTGRNSDRVSVDTTGNQGERPSSEHRSYVFQPFSGTIPEAFLPMKTDGSRARQTISSELGMGQDLLAVATEGRRSGKNPLSVVSRTVADAVADRLVAESMKPRRSEHAQQLLSRAVDSSIAGAIGLSVRAFMFNEMTGRSAIDKEKLSNIASGCYDVNAKRNKIRLEETTERTASSYRFPRQEKFSSRVQWQHVFSRVAKGKSFTFPRQPVAAHAEYEEFCAG